MIDRCLEAMVKNALEAGWEARFEGMLKVNSFCAHCLMGESYFGRRECLMSHLTLEGSFDPLPHGRWVVTS
jgi:hypothetical protein